MRTPKGREVLALLEKWVKYHPNAKTIQLSPAEFEIILSSLSKSQHAFYNNEIPYKGKIIKRGE